MIEYLIAPTLRQAGIKAMPILSSLHPVLWLVLGLVGLLLCAGAIGFMAMIMLLWRAANRLIQGAASFQDKALAYAIIASTICALVPWLGRAGLARFGKIAAEGIQREEHNPTELDDPDPSC